MPAPGFDSESRSDFEAALDAAGDLLVHDGFDAVTWKSVASRSGVAEDRVREFFDSTEDLLVSMLNREYSGMFRVIVDNIERDPLGGLMSRIYRYVFHAVYERPLARTLYLMDRDGLNRIMRASNGFAYIPQLGIFWAVVWSVRALPRPALRWTPVCDGFGIVYASLPALLAVFWALVWVAGLQPWTWRGRIGCVAACGAVAVAGFVVIFPECGHGPFSQVAPRLELLWRQHVAESQSLFALFPGGWWQPPLRMREVQQYLIDNDSLAMRYDVRWEKPSGDMIQYHVDFDQYLQLTGPICEPPADVLEHQRQRARDVFERIERQNGFKRIHQVELHLPRSANIARYV